MENNLIRFLVIFGMSVGAWSSDITTEVADNTSVEKEECSRRAENSFSQESTQEAEQSKDVLEQIGSENNAQNSFLTRIKQSYPFVQNIEQEGVIKISSGKLSGQIRFKIDGNSFRYGFCPCGSNKNNPASFSRLIKREENIANFYDRDLDKDLQVPPNASTIDIEVICEVDATLASNTQSHTN